MLLDTDPQPTRFGRLYAPDPLDRLHPMRASAVAAALHVERFWKTGVCYNQGDYPHCVGFTGLHYLEAEPIMARRGRILPTAIDLYRGAQRNDEYEGENYDGSTGRGLMKYMQSLGLIREYVWGRNIQDVKNFTLTRGPSCAGSEWFSGMSKPKWVGSRTKGGFYLEPTGHWQGGHEYLISGYSRKRHAFRIFNSWGPSWAEKGRAWIDYDVFDHLIFGMNGDVVSAMETDPLKAV